MTITITFELDEAAQLCALAQMGRAHMRDEQPAHSFNANWRARTRDRALTKLDLALKAAGR